MFRRSYIVLIVMLFLGWLSACGELEDSPGAAGAGVAGASAFAGEGGAAGASMALRGAAAGAAGAAKFPYCAAGVVTGMACQAETDPLCRVAVPGAVDSLCQCNPDTDRWACEPECPCCAKVIAPGEPCDPALNIHVCSVKVPEEPGGLDHLCSCTGPAWTCQLQ